MGRYTELFTRTQVVADAFASIPKSAQIRVISHYDSDGLCASAILIKALLRKKLTYSVSVYQTLSTEVLGELSREDNTYYILADLGSSSIGNIEKHLASKTVFILDHHPIDKETTLPNIYHLNPHCFGIDGSKEIAGAGVALLFAIALDPKNRDQAHLAIIGALGDIQEDDGFLKLNQDILKSAVSQGTIEVKTELRVFGRETKPLVKILSHMNDPLIPGVTGSEQGAIKLLKACKIDPKKGPRWRLMTDLTKKQEDTLARAIISRRLEQDLIGNIFGNSYIISSEQKGSPLRDAREFSTLLNACGRTNASSIGIGACLGSQKMKEKAFVKLAEYRQKMNGAMQWFKDNKGSFIEGKGYAIINAKDNIPSEMIGTMTSILSHGGSYPENTCILSMARNPEKDETKVSMRCVGKGKEALHLMMQRIASAVGGQYGGHESAAGAIINTSDEHAFTEHAIKILERSWLEERIE